MAQVTVTYPVTPQPVEESVIQPSSTFKQEVLSVLFAIIFFVVVYVVLMAAALALAALCAAGGFLLVVNVPRFITLMIGIGLIGLGLLVVFFLLKFLFKRKKADRSHLFEIKEKDQPELFAFIRTLTKETHAPFPKKVYLAADVNACVFYDSSFWSMFFPVKKNLQIGLGLVNSVNMSEFKAILAHEFGHFSQRSMKLGSYVYNVNQIIYNMLYDNDGYERTLQGFASVSGYFAFFANITIKIVAGIQWILQNVYAIINKRYMSLSRQMEFHADSVAAYVSGSDHLITSLRRLDVADSAYNRLFEYYSLWYKLNLKPDNLYLQHAEIMKQFAEEHSIPLENGLPYINAQTFAHFNKTRVVLKDQWASHPSIDDREAHLRSLDIRTDALKISAWSIFRSPETLQRQVTEKIYSTVTFTETPQVLDFTAFRQRYLTEVAKYKLDRRYKGFFNYRHISTIDLSSARYQEPDNNPTLDEILNETVLSLPNVINGLRADLNTLEAIQNGSVTVKTFEFGGAKYKRDDAGKLIGQLKEELNEAESRLVKADTEVLTFFLRAAQRHGQVDQLKDQYSHLFKTVEVAEEDLKKYVEMMQDIQPVYYHTLEFSHIRQIFYKVKHNEVLMQERLRKMLDNADYASFFTADDRKKAEEYLAHDHVYFSEPNFNNEALTLFNEVSALYQAVINEHVFTVKKTLLEKQLSYVGNVG